MGNRTLETLADLLFSLPVFAWGVADISGLHPLCAEYPMALSVLVSYAPTFEVYSEPEYHNLLEKAAVQIDAASSAVSDFLQAARIKHLCIPRGGARPQNTDGDISA